MIAGFDYGTSNCAMTAVTAEGVSVVPLYGEQTLVPSTLYAYERSLIMAALAQQLPDDAGKADFLRTRSTLLAKAREDMREYDLDQAAQGLFFGEDAIAQYTAAPDEGYFIKSPKSFLGASGLRQNSIDFFEDVVAAMMLNVKQRAEQFLGQSIRQVMIGRPVNFQGIDTETSNRQAQAILDAAGKRCGFTDIGFLYEPLAAGFDFETRLTEERRVLVVDVGGGTTDCSMVLMGPKRLPNRDRSGDFLGHSGERIGGNDFDIALATRLLMPSFGMSSFLKSGLPMPVSPFVNAMAINDLGAQADFYDQKTALLLDRLLLDTTEPALLNRFVGMRHHRQNFAVVREAEQGKIGLSSQLLHQADLGFIEPDLTVACESEVYARVTEPLCVKIAALVQDAIDQAGSLPDCVYLTGGSARSPLIRAAIQQRVGDSLPLIDGDYFGSVAKGLGIYADRYFAS